MITRVRLPVGAGMRRDRPSPGLPNERLVADEHLDRLPRGAQKVGGLVLEVAPEVADAVAAVQRAAADVIQRQPGLAVRDDLRHVRVQRGDLVDEDAAELGTYVESKPARDISGGSRSS